MWYQNMKMLSIDGLKAGRDGVHWEQIVVSYMSDVWWDKISYVQILVKEIT